MKTVSLELAKQLKEAGFPQEGKFKYCGGHTMFWEDQENGKFEECENSDLLGEDEYCHTAELTCEFFIAAPTADELLEKLPTGTKIREDIGGYDAYHPALTIQGSFVTKSVADSLAALWLYLQRNNLLT